MDHSLYSIKKVRLQKEGFKLNINKFEVHRGAIYLISGKINSGKSLFVNILNNKVSYEGNILYEGEDLRGVNKKNYLNDVCFISSLPFVSSISCHTLYFNKSFLKVSPTSPNFLFFSIKSTSLKLLQVI